MALKEQFLTDHLLTIFADESVNNYELSCEWRKAGQAAQDLAADDFGIRLTNSQVGTIVNIAKQKWMSRIVAVQKSIN